MMSGQLIFIALLLANILEALPDNGMADINDENRMFGGIEAPPGSYPYMVALLVSNLDISCGGSILNQYRVLTAAHCLEDGVSHLSAVAGIKNRCGVPNMEAHSQQIRKIRSYIMHERYLHTENPFRMENDIGIVTVVMPFQFNSYVQPVRLPTAHLNQNAACILTGWGGTLSNPNIRGNYRKQNLIPWLVNMPCHLRVGLLITHDACRYNFNFFRPETKICAGYVTRMQRQGSNAGSCPGDSGGPLVCGDVQHGITSFGIGQCTFATAGPAAFTRVSAFIPWINSVVRNG